MGKPEGKNGVSDRLAAALSTLLVVGAATDSPAIRAKIQAMMDGKGGTKNAIVQVYEPDVDQEEQVDGNTLPRAELIRSIEDRCPNPIGVIEAEDPELAALIRTEHPELLQAGILGDILGLLGDLIFGLIGSLGIRGTIIVAFLGWIFGWKKLLKGGWNLGKKLLTGKEADDESLGQTLGRELIPQLVAILAEIAPDAALAMNNLSPDNRRILAEFCGVVARQFSYLKFKDEQEGINLFKLAIKCKYLQIRINEIEEALTVAAAPAAPLADAQRAALEEELNNLRTAEETVLRQVSNNTLPVSSIRKAGTARLAQAANAEIEARMIPAGRPVNEVRAVQDVVRRELVLFPELYSEDSNLRLEKILRFKLQYWRHKYDRAIAIAGPGTVVPPNDAPATIRSSYNAARAFIQIYGEIQEELRLLLEERGRVDRTMARIDARLPMSAVKRRALIAATILLLLGGGHRTWKWAFPQSPATPLPPSSGELKDKELERRRYEEQRQRSKKRTDDFWDRVNRDEPGNP